jgi:integrase
MSLKRVWVYQDDKQVKKHGAKAASWYVGFYDPDGKRRCQSCGAGARGKKLAGQLARKLSAQLITGTYQSKDRKTWAEFREEYEAKIVEGLGINTRRQVLNALNHFERIIKPKKASAVRTQTIDTFRAKRRSEAGKKAESIVSRATINKELRHLRAALRKARKWGYLAEAPDFEFEKEAQELPVFVTPAHFAAIYKACDVAKLPSGQGYSPVDWWRALIVMAYMTGWRISELLGLHRDDVNLEKGEAVTRADANKGKRDEAVKLHPVVIQHLRKLTGFSPTMFPWYRSQWALMQEFAGIQEQAGVHLPCHGKHVHTRHCHVYGFHDFRRAFATMNADRLTADALQALMRHKSYQTTQKYINLARQLDSAVDGLHVPEVLQGKKA